MNSGTVVTALATTLVYTPYEPEVRPAQDVLLVLADAWDFSLPPAAFSASYQEYGILQSTLYTNTTR